MKTVLITGANKSIGYETAKYLAAQGYYIYIGSRDINRGQQAVTQLQKEGYTSVEAVQLDVTDASSVQKAKAYIESKGGVLDVLINNAGILGQMPQQAGSVATENVKEVFETNFFGVITVTVAFLDLLKKAAQPRIVNVTSGLGSLTLHSDPAWSYYAYKTAAYGTSKTALNAYTVVLAYELRDTAFKVNAVDPGYTATDFNEHRGPRNVADSGVFIAKYALLDADGPTGKFFSPEIAGEESPW
ncbi:NAD(P)-dependent dehydrogenase, short-chain alcohol dehydrogenase family [Filimonas lacunae]|uniref:NAD(P)-dependent dehydrogenase, short-chain alcohol dehydrogenase family n=1 Tax=Filimonas lacunae TaxID=477680 RepID=A0A173MHS0_9BACT|nr:SDR family oxidoreductase [Filimonas lacunae]BAV07145.1 short chain dehydrogenase [Filimonas lacunae]SIS94353.1 NAD(P)-dependent dehydrogenase, short-chain alcohol dehydrogenase family [Filimonas lacunae]